MLFNVSTLTVDRSMNIDNVKVDNVNIWPAYDMDIIGVEPNVTILRLQLGTTYKNISGSYVDEGWSTYNYDRTLIKRHAKSISVTATPPIVPVAGNYSDIAAYVKDQYNEAISGVRVYFSDDDSTPSGASVTPGYDDTDLFGKAVTQFISGTVEKDVKITATCTFIE
jgi:hypothetical protein